LPSPPPPGQARDEDNNPRLSGGDAFVVTLLRGAGPPGPAAAAALAAPGEAPAAADAHAGGGGEAEQEGGEEEEQGEGRQQGRLEVVAAGAVGDGGDGSYRAAYRLDAAGRYLLAVTDGAPAPGPSSSPPFARSALSSGCVGRRGWGPCLPAPAGLC
jgi:hypothetical protein